MKKRASWITLYTAMFAVSASAVILTCAAYGKSLITLSEERVLQIAVPYSEGWTARVDGVKAGLTECGGMYMGLKLESGTHIIELRYFTPGLKTGLAVSAAAAVIIAALLIISGKNKKTRKQLFCY